MSDSFPAGPSASESESPLNQGDHCCDDNEREPFWRKFLKYRNQIVATAIVTIGSFGTGTVFGWSALATDDIYHRKEFGNISKASEISWVTSLAIFGAFLAGPVAGYGMNALGRRKSIMFFSVPFTVGWIIMCLPYLTRPWGFFLLYIGRLVTGFCAGCYLVVIPTYIKEVAEDSIRGILGSAMPLMLVSGILYTFIIGTYCHWAILTASCGIVPILLCLGSTIIPETPRYLISKNQLNEAIDAYKWLQGIKSENYDEVEVKPEMIYSGDGLAETSTVQKRRWTKLFSRPVILPIITMTMIMFFQQFGGVNAVTLYTVEIFKSAGDFIDPQSATIILGVFQVVFVLVSMALVDLLGRKTLLASCSLIMGVCIILLGYYFHLKESGNKSVKDILWLPVASTWTYIAAYSCGVGSIPWVLANELYHPDYRAQSATAMTSSYWIFGFIVAQTYPKLKDLVSDSGCFWFYGVFCLLGSLFALIFVPETKGKSSEEILKYFDGSRRTSSPRHCYSNDTDNYTINSNTGLNQESTMLNLQSDTAPRETSNNNKIDDV